MSAAAGPESKINKDMKEAFVTPALDFAGELIRLFPDSLQFGSLLLYLLTQNTTFGIFTIFTIEVSLFHKLVGFVLKGASGSDTSRRADPQCRSGFRTVRTDFERSYANNTSPSVSMFTLGAIAVYLSFANFLFKDTLTTMGPIWSGRLWFGISFLILMSLFMIVYQVLRGCDTMMGVLVALLFGSFAGGIFYFVNYNLFGVEAMNFLGLPSIVNKADQGAPIYVCAPTLQPV
jgi:hypothetical protein